jgi:hypothetical protein
MKMLFQRFDTCDSTLKDLRHGAHCKAGQIWFLYNVQPKT